ARLDQHRVSDGVEVRGRIQLFEASYRSGYANSLFAHQLQLQTLIVQRRSKGCIWIEQRVMLFQCRAVFSEKGCSKIEASQDRRLVIETQPLQQLQQILLPVRRLRQQIFASRKARQRREVALARRYDDGLKACRVQ